MPLPPSEGSGVSYPAGETVVPYPYPAGAVGDIPSPEQLLAPEPILQDFYENGEPRGDAGGNLFGIIAEPFFRIFR